ncbi:MAG: hypothetical protein ACXW2E_00335 [Nitrososphaeraceae archaeon]
MDIDIDFPTKFKCNKYFPQAIQASLIKEKKLSQHPCGYYFQTIPIDEITHLSAIPYKEAERLGYFKVDFLHLSMLDNVRSKSELRALIKDDPDWSLLHHYEKVQKLAHINRHFDLIQQVRPSSVQELADCLALIRPAKKHLINQYINLSSHNRYKLHPELYKQPGTGEIWFKKSHSIAYAYCIVAQLHLIQQGRL